MSGDTNFVSILAERAGTFSIVRDPKFQKALAKAGAGENSKSKSTTITVYTLSEYLQAISSNAMRRRLGPNVAGVIAFWNEREVKCITADGGEVVSRGTIAEFPGFLTTVIIEVDAQREAIANFRDMAATAPIRKIIVNAIRTIRNSADDADKAVDAGNYSQLNTLCVALRESVSQIEHNSKALSA